MKKLGNEFAKFILAACFGVTIFMTAPKSALAQTSPPPPERVLNFSVVIQTQLTEERLILQHLQNVLMVLQAGAPERYNVGYDPSKPRDFVIEVVDQKWIESTLANPKFKKAKNFIGDGYSTYLSELPGSPVVVRVIWDEAFLQNVGGKWVGRTDAFTRLCVLLGHEIYGNVVFFKENAAEIRLLDLLGDPKRNAAFANKMELNAFKSGMSFIKRVSAAFGKRITPKMQNDLAVAYGREQEMLQKYQKMANPTGAPPNPCDGIFSSN